MNKIFVMYCRTGCTCCADENHYRGFYLSIEEAQARKDRFLKGIDNPLSSQFSKYGMYKIEERSAEVLPDGRIIVGGITVIQPSDVVTVNTSDGSVDKSDYLYG